MATGDPTSILRFERPEHRAIASLLAGMNSDTLARAQCFFAGGTAIVMTTREYRLSRDVDFLCADRDGYRFLREQFDAAGPSALFGTGVEVVREFRSDQYGIRGVVAIDGIAIKTEFVREGRIELSGSPDIELGVPVLAATDQFAEKLLANTDRGFDRSAGYRDVIDLGMLVGANGLIPESSVQKAEAAYGTAVAKSLSGVLARLGAAEQDYVAEVLQMEKGDVRSALYDLCAAAMKVWPELEFRIGPP